MTAAIYDSAYAPAARPRQRRFWPWRLLFGPDAPPQPGPRRNGLPDDIPEWLRLERARAANVRPIPGRSYQPPKLSDYELKPELPEPPPEPIVKIDRIADMKFQLRKVFTYGEFMAAVEGMGCDPKTAWKWATT